MRLRMMVGWVLCGALSLPAAGRTWTSASGATVEAEFEALRGGQVVVLRRADGRPLQIRLDQLSDADREYVREQAGPAEEAEGFEALLDAGPATWALSEDDFMAAYGALGFEWQSDARRAAHVEKEGLTLMGLPLQAAQVRFDNQSPNEVIFMLYTRGDMGDLSREAFSEQLEGAQAALSRWTDGSAPRDADGLLQTRGARVQGRYWEKEGTKAQMEWSYSTRDASGNATFRSEYIRVVCTPFDLMAAMAGPARGQAARREREVSLEELRQQVRREPNGDVHIADIPMVDQGEKGYCAVATMDRIMRYYQLPVDQHMMAQFADSTADQGTAPDLMFDALRRMGTRIGCKVSVRQQFDVSSFQRMVSAYNREAKRARLEEISLGRMIDVAAVYQAMDTDILRAARLRDSPRYRRFLSDIEQNVDQGIPVVWSLVLGKISENLPQASGGHMRLIIGYNHETEEIIYSDSWGSGHEFKRMKAEDAWAVTTGVYVVEPRYTR